MANCGKIVFGGEFVNNDSGSGVDVEEWSCSFATQHGNAMLLPGVLEGIAAILADYVSSDDLQLHDTVNLSYVKAFEIDMTTGHVVTDPVPVYSWSGTTRPRGAGTSPVLPLSCAARVSLDDSTRNRRHRGGFYLPRPAWSIGPGGRFGSNVTDALGATHDMLVDGIMGDFNPGIYSKAGQYFTPATRLRIGNVPDTIRRRRNELQELYAETGL